MAENFGKAQALGLVRLLKASHFLLVMLTIIGLSRPMMVVAEEAKSEAQQQEIQSDDAVRRAHVRSLAASCTVCHGQSGHSQSGDNDAGKIAGLAGIKATDFIEKLQAFKSGERTATVMHHHAKGLNSQEISDLAAYFSTQIPHQAVVLPSQKLLANHAN